MKYIVVVAQEATDGQVYAITHVDCKGATKTTNGSTTEDKTTE